MKLVIGIAVVALLIAGFAWVRSISQQPIAGGGLPVTGIEWRPAMIGGLPVIEADTMHVRFEVDGEIAGHGGCNRFFGSLQQNEAGVEVGMLGSTRMACAEPVSE